jgi:hypothetical protein
MAEAMLDGAGEELIRQAIGMALAGDAQALRLCIERIIPARKDRPVSIDMPKINSASDLIRAAASLTEAATSGEITPAEAAALSTLVANTAKAVETFEIVERLTKLEELTAGKSANP